MPARMASGRTALTSRPVLRAPGTAASLATSSTSSRPAAAPPRGRGRHRAGVRARHASRAPAAARPAAHVLGLHDGQRGPDRGHGQRLAAEGRCRGRPGRRPPPPRPGPSRPHRHAVAQGLGHGHDVGLEALAPGRRTNGPVRPRPVWTSSSMSSASRSVHICPHGAQVVRDWAPSRPPSPWSGSSRTAATVAGSTPRPGRRRRRRGRARSPRAAGANGACFSGWPVAVSVARVRPWNELSALITTWRPAPGPAPGQLEGALVGLGPRIGEEDLATGPAGAAVDQPVDGARRPRAPGCCRRGSRRGSGSGPGSATASATDRVGVPERGRRPGR